MYVGGPARYFIEVSSVDELREALAFAKEKDLPHFILGRGSNILVSDSGFDGVVIRIAILGIQLLKETDTYAEYEVGGGEIWDEFVKYSVDQSLYGIENMSHVPGSVGASVVQNIGCYGQEVSETVQYIKAISAINLNEAVLTKDDLKFSYRRSILNNPKSSKDLFVVTHVIFRLNKHGHVNMNFGDVKKYFADNPSIVPSLKSVREALISIRDSKYPFPDSPEHGSCGSFFNADPIDNCIYEKIVSELRRRGFDKKAQEMVDKKNVFAVAQGFKVPYGVLVEVLDFKGKSHGGAKVLKTHSCVINNYTGQARARDVYDLSEHVIVTVHREFGVKLKTEPELVGKFEPASPV